MLSLSLFWLGIGVVVGALALGARLRPAAWGRRGWIVVLGIAAAAALVGGWLGTLVFGRYFGTATALWVSVLVAAATPWICAMLYSRERDRRHMTTEQP